MSKPISYALSYYEWTDIIMRLTDAQAGMMLKALLQTTFSENDNFTRHLADQKAVLIEQVSQGEITPDEWKVRTDTLSALEVLWNRFRAAAEKNVNTFKNYSASNARNNKRGKGSARSVEPLTTTPLSCGNHDGNEEQYGSD